MRDFRIENWYYFLFFFFFFFFFSRQHFEIFFSHFSPANRIWQLKYQILFWRQFAWKGKSCFLGNKEKKNITNLSSAELAQRVVKVKERDYYNGVFVWLENFSVVLTPSFHLQPKAHQDSQTCKTCNMPHANRKDLKQQTHPNAEIAGDQPTTLNVAHCEKIIYTKHMSLVPACRPSSKLHFISFVITLNKLNVQLM